MEIGQGQGAAAAEQSDPEPEGGDMLGLRPLQIQHRLAQLMGAVDHVAAVPQALVCLGQGSEGVDVGGMLAFAGAVGQRHQGGGVKPHVGNRGVVRGGHLDEAAHLVDIARQHRGRALHLRSMGVGRSGLVQLAQLGRRRVRHALETVGAAGTVGGSHLKIVDAGGGRRQNVAIDRTREHRRFVNPLAAGQQEAAGHRDDRRDHDRHAPDDRDARANPHARPAAQSRAPAAR
ncbi:hypothetical protein [Azospirillum palustre]